MTGAGGTPPPRWTQLSTSEGRLTTVTRIMGAGRGRGGTGKGTGKGRVSEGRLVCEPAVNDAP